MAPPYQLPPAPPMHPRPSACGCRPPFDLQYVLPVQVVAHVVAGRLWLTHGATEDTGTSLNTPER